MPEFQIKSPRLILRGWRAEDIAPFHAMGQDPAVMEYLGPLMTLEDAQDAVARQQALQQAQGLCFWAVETRADARFIGFCGIKPGPEGTPLEGCMEIGWRLAADCWGQGYAREAATACLHWGFDQAAMERIWAMTVLGNVRSWGLMERLGMERHAELDFDHPNVADGSPLKPHIIYSIGRAQWTASASSH